MLPRQGPPNGGRQAIATAGGWISGAGPGCGGGRTIRRLDLKAAHGRIGPEQ